MSNSYSNRLEFTCPETNQPFEAEIWLIVDVKEAPHLLQKMQEDSLHIIVSPYTGKTLGEVDAPLLIFRADESPTLFFSPAHNTTPEEDLQQASDLVERLRQNLGVDWKDNWLKDGLPTIHRLHLPEFLDGPSHIEDEHETDQVNEIFVEQLEKVFQMLDEGGTEREKLDSMFKLAGSLPDTNAGVAPPDFSDLSEIFQILVLLEETTDHDLKIQMSQRAIMLMQNTEMPHLWAKNIASLYVEIGNAYFYKPDGDIVDRVSQAIKYFEAALDLIRKEEEPVFWAQTISNLGNAYAMSFGKDRQEKSRKAVQCFLAALEVLSKEEQPNFWADIQNNLGEHSNKMFSDFGNITYDGGTLLNLGINSLQNALSVYTISETPLDWAMANLNLGRVLMNRGENNDLETALNHFNDACEVYIKSDNRADWALVQVNIGETLSKLNKLNEAKVAYQNALDFYSTTNFVATAALHSRLVDIYFSQLDWEKVIAHGNEAVHALEDVFIHSYTVEGRNLAVSDNASLHYKLAYALVQAGEENYEAALQQIEAGKARLLFETLNLREINTDKITKAQQEKLQSLQREVRSTEAIYRLSTNRLSPEEDRQFADKLRESRENLRDFLGALKEQYPEFLPKGLGIKRILSLIPETSVLIAPLFTSHGSIIFIIPHGIQRIEENHIIYLDDFILDDIRTLTYGTEENPGWLRFYTKYRFGQSSIHDLRDGIERVTSQIWQILVDRIHSSKFPVDTKYMFILPQGNIHMLPIHAAWHQKNGVRKYLLDDYIVKYLPTIAMLDSKQNSPESGNGAFIAGVSEYTKLKPLPNTHIEARSIAQLMDIQPTLNADVSINTVEESVVGKKYVHLSCHGGFGWLEGADASALYLGNDEIMSLPYIAGNLDMKGVRLVVLSACETGIMDFRDLPDEFIGLPAGFIQAGSSAIVSSLWVVEDLSTMLLMGRFYQNHLRDHLEMAEALRDAQIWLRNVEATELRQLFEAERKKSDESWLTREEINKYWRRFALLEPDAKPFAHPYYWASFTFTGA